MREGFTRRFHKHNGQLRKVRRACPGFEIDFFSQFQFIQANLQRSKLATAELLVAAERKGISVSLVQEPYMRKIGLLKQHLGIRQVKSSGALSTARNQ